MDLMVLETKTVLHTADCNLKHFAACFLTEESTKDIWDVFLKIWVNEYAGFPDSIAFHQGSQFTSDEWDMILAYYGVNNQASGAKSHNALGSGVCYHSDLRQMYCRVRLWLFRRLAKACTIYWSLLFLDIAQVLYR